MYYRDKVLACAKHFVGDGGTVNGINENNTVIDWHRLLSIHMPGYYQAIIKGVSTIMVSYSSWNGVKMHANRELITVFLKNRHYSGFLSNGKGLLLLGSIHDRCLRQYFLQGFVISDWQGIDRITDPPHSNYTYSVQAAIGAGIDMVSNERTSCFKDLLLELEVQKFL